MVHRHSSRRLVSATLRQPASLRWLFVAKWTSSVDASALAFGCKWKAGDGVPDELNDGTRGSWPCIGAKSYDRNGVSTHKRQELVVIRVEGRERDCHFFS